jgi:hypothetical protein
VFDGPGALENDEEAFGGRRDHDAVELPAFGCAIVEQVLK